MNEKKFYKNTIKNVLKIFNVLKNFEKKEEGFLTVSKLSKLTGLHKWTVSRTLDLYMHPFVDIITPEGFEDVGLQIKFIKLKNVKIKEEQVLRFLKFSKIIRGRE
jgi:hypothetical protein